MFVNEKQFDRMFLKSKNETKLFCFSQETANGLILKGEATAR